MANQTFNLIEEITRLDGSTYFELGNIIMNGRAELAAERGLIKQVRILKLNIPHSQHVEQLERYINSMYDVPTEDMTEWVEWKRDPQMEQQMVSILEDNQVN
jgi:hypothetical protein